MHLFKLYAAMVFSVLIISCGGGGGDGDLKGDSLVRGPLTTTALSDLELLNLARSATVLITASGKIYKPDGSILQNWRGSGFFISDTGYIVTNNHVVTGAGELKVKVNGISSPYNAEVVGVAECADLAVIKLNSGSGFPALSWYDSQLDPGLPVAAAGFPGDIAAILGEPEFALNKGDITTKPKKVGANWSFVEEAVVHSAQISGGNSGGPLLERNTGMVAGVNYAGGANRYLAVANTTAKKIVDELIKGNNIYSIGATLELVFVDNKPLGVFVKAVQAGGKAANIGIQPGDVITQVASVPLFLSEQETPSTGAEKYSLEKYCSVLASNNPNNPEDPGDKGKVIEVKVFRMSNSEFCTGEINGKRLSCTPLNGGGNGGRDVTTVDGNLTDTDYIMRSDGTYYDIYAFTASASGTATITMSSLDIDAYLLVLDGDNKIIADDNNGGGGSNAEVTFEVTQGAKYYVIANQFETATGSYTLTFSSNLTGIQQIQQK